MSLGDIIFLGFALVSIGFVLRGLYLLLRRRWRRAGLNFAVLLALGVVYCAALVTAALVGGQRVAKLGERLRFDDWCIAVEKAATRGEIGGVSAPAGTRFWLVTVEVSSEARRVAQRETNVWIYLVDAKGNRYLADPAGQPALEQEGAAGPALTSRLQPGESFEHTEAFAIPVEAQGLGAVVAHAWFPGALIIGGSESVFHQPTITPLTPAGETEPASGKASVR